MKKIDYFKEFDGFHKYDEVKSVLLYGNVEVKPKYSVVIPTYRRTELLRLSITSCLKQTYGDFTVTIVDNDGDCSEESSETYSLIKSLADSRIIYYKNEKNIGIYANTLRAFELASCEYAVLLNDDDILHPEYLRILDVFVLRFRPKGIIGAMPANFIGENVPTIKLEPGEEIICLKVTPELYYGNFYVTSPGLTIYKENLHRIYNPYEELLMGDQIMMYKSIKKYGLYRIEKPLAYYRHLCNATIRDDIIISMMVNMCLFKSQVAQSRLFLRIYNKVFKKYIWFENVHGFVCGWHKEYLLYPIMHELGVDDYPLWFGRKMFLKRYVARFIIRLKRKWPKKYRMIFNVK